MKKMEKNTLKKYCIAAIIFSVITAILFVIRYGGISIPCVDPKNIERCAGLGLLVSSVLGIFILNEYLKKPDECECLKQKEKCADNCKCKHGEN